MKILLVVLALAYFLSPWDLLPEGLIGIKGYLDDLVLVYLMYRYVLFRVKTSPMPGGQQFRYRRDGGRKAGEGAGRPKDDPEAFEPNDPYRILGVDRDAAPEEIKSAYRRLAAKYHPDKVAYLGDEFKQLAEKRFKDIQEAYQRISPDN